MFHPSELLASLLTCFVHGNSKKWKYIVFTSVYFCGKEWAVSNLAAIIQIIA